MAIQRSRNESTGNFNEHLIVADYNVMSKTISLSHVPLVLLNIGADIDPSSYSPEDLSLALSTAPAAGQMPSDPVPAQSARREPERVARTLERSGSSKLGQEIAGAAIPQASMTPYQRMMTGKVRRNPGSNLG